MLGPIFNRELLTLPRRGRLHLIRSLYLLVLWVLALTAWQTAFGWEQGVTQGDLAYFGTLVFKLLSFLQLTVVLFFSALFAASAVTQEKDRRTFVLLLLTDLSNSEIVLGKLFGSLLQIGALVISAVPVLALIMLLGGVSFEQVLLTLLISIASAVAAGALGCLLAIWREKTYQALALTLLCLVLYLLVVEGLATLGGWFDAAGWQTRLSPFRALYAVIEPGLGMAAASSAFAFTACMLVVATLLSGLGIWKLRAWNPSGEPIQRPETPEAEAEQEAVERQASAHAAPGKVREVWTNPVLWREIRTRAYGRRSLLIKAAYLLVFGLVFFSVYRSLPHAANIGVDRLFPAWGLVPIVVLSLLLLNAQSVTSVTSERDLKALDLLLVTDLSPREFVFGKLGGIFYNTKEIVLPPLLLGGAFVWWGLIGFEAFFFILLTLLVLMVFTAVLGLHVSLHTANSRLAIGYSLGTIFFLFIGTLICIYLIRASGRFEYQWTSFIFFLAIGIGGLWLVLSGNRPSLAVNIAAGLCPPSIFYAAISVLIGNPTTGKGGDPLMPFVVIGFALSFTVAAMLVPLLSDFDVTFDYSAPADE